MFPLNNRGILVGARAVGLVSNLRAKISTSTKPTMPLDRPRPQKNSDQPWNIILQYSENQLVIILLGSCSQQDGCRKNKFLTVESISMPIAQGQIPQGEQSRRSLQRAGRSFGPDLGDRFSGHKSLALSSSLIL